MFFGCLRPMPVRVLFHVRAVFAIRRSFMLAALDEFMAFHATPGVPALHSRTVRVHINGPIGPHAAPRTVVDVKTVTAPIKAAVSPAPRAKKCANRHAKTKANRSTYDKAWPRPGVN